jgi:7-carboxy-7-deazaguanine synthase
MPYAIKEIYYTLQGEGLNAGRAAVFVRFTGCNLWSGREEDRERGIGGCARWCDTDFVGIDGPGGGTFASARELAARVRATWGAEHSRERLVILTGGEPLLQVDDDLVGALHDLAFRVAVETNGTLPLPSGIDWVCVSPKARSRVVVRRGDELKFVFPQEGIDPSDFEELEFEHLLLQPRDGVAQAVHTAAAVAYCLSHPKWRLSLQTHKFLGIP